VVGYLPTKGDSPRHRFTRRPSLHLRRIEGEKTKKHSAIFQFPLCAKGEDRVVGRSLDRVSALCLRYSYIHQKQPCELLLVYMYI
jgi:hypothetical protein